MRTRISAILQLAAFLTSVFLLGLPQLRAQGTGAATFSKTFNVLPSAATTYLSIPNNNQIAHSVSVSSSDAFHGHCTVLLDGSIDKKNWETIASNGNMFSMPAILTGTFNGNGAYVYYRLKVLPCTMPTTNIVYMGYAAFLPPVSTSFNYITPIYFLKGIFTDPHTPGILEGFQASNPDKGKGIEVSTLNSGGHGYAINNSGTIDGGSVLATYKVLTVVTYPVTAVDQTGGAGTNFFTVAGNQTAHFVAGHTFKVSSSTGNNGTYTIVSSAFGVATDIVTVEAIPDATADGELTADDAAVLNYTLLFAGYGYATGTGITTTVGLPLPGIGTGFTIDISAVSTGTAWLQLFFAAPGTCNMLTLGTGFFFQAAVPPGAWFTYTGPPISMFGTTGLTAPIQLCAGAATAPGGATPVGGANALSCNFQLNYAGPYYPYTPPSP